MLEQVRQALQKFQLITAGQTVVVGVSGGTDSLALLHVLTQLSPRLGFRLHAATLDHQLRGDESQGDARFVEQICREWGIAVTVGQADVKQLAVERQLGIEAAARLARYDFLAKVAHTVGATCVAVAHHMDDQAETVLLHLLRGTGVHGLAGMTMRSRVPNHADLWLIRPLLRASRSEIEAYCVQYHLAARHDSSNTDTTLLRNAIRLEVLPFLTQYSPHVKPALARLADIAAVEDNYVNQQVLAFTNSSAVKAFVGIVSIEREVFRKLHPALQRRVIMWSAAQAGQTGDTSADLMLGAVESALHGQQGAIALLGGGYRLRVEYELLVVESNTTENRDRDIPLVPTDCDIRIEVPSEHVFAGWTLNVMLRPPESNSPYCRLSIANGSQMVLRTQRDGDIFSPLGMNGHSQKLSRFMVNRKIPQRFRDQIPLIVVDRQVAAIHYKGSWFVSEAFAERNTSERIIYFQFLENS